MKLKRVMAFLIALTMILPSGINTRAQNTKQEGQKKEYLVMAKTDDAIRKVNDKYDSLINQYTEYIEEENMSLTRMTDLEAERLEKDRDIVSVEENIEFTGSGKQKELDPDKVVSDWNMELINAESAKRTSQKKKDKIKIAIIDSGVDECEGIEVKERYNLVPSEKEVLPIYDDITGHGTAIASVIAASKVGDRESKGINENVELYSIKVMDGDNTAPLSRIVEGIYKAIEYDVDIINMSFGTIIDSEILYQAVRDAYDAGILMVAAAGNRGDSDEKVEYPAAYEEVMAVGSVDSNASISSTSSTGEEIDVMAPGELVKTATNFGMETVTSGTSIATPHVVGVASILWQKDKSKSANFIRGLIEETSKEISKNGEEYAIIDLEYALNKYKEYEKNSNNKSYEVKQSTGRLEICDEMAKVTARWSKSDHETLVKNANGGKLTTKELNLVKLGIRYNDAKLRSDDNNKYRYIWHSLTNKSNYISAVFYVGKVIQQDELRADKVPQTPGLVTEIYKQMKSDINDITGINVSEGNKKQIEKEKKKWKAILDVKDLNINDYPCNDKNKRFILFGMSLHIITDAFAHRSFIKTTPGDRWGGWFHIGSPETDNTTVIPTRYKAAGQVVKNAFTDCLNANKPKKSTTIRSKHIMDNKYMNGSFALEKLVLWARTNAQNDNSYEKWRKTMALYSYAKSNTDRLEIEKLEK